jgi:hypothetical protein
MDQDNYWLIFLTFTPHTTLPVNPFHVVVEVPAEKLLAFGTIMDYLSKWDSVG